MAKLATPGDLEAINRSIALSLLKTAMDHINRAIDRARDAGDPQLARAIEKMRERALRG